MYKNYLKRRFDFVFGLLLLIVLFPVAILVFVLLLLPTDFNPIFKQPRPGLNGKTIILYKFRTMNELRTPDGSLLSDEKRIFWLGNLLRKSSLDELPQLINVLKGEMSFIGPRPLLTEYLAYYNDQQNRRHEVLPGITGWAQINGRNTLSWQRKFELDIWYVDHLSFLLDLKIIFMTIKKILTREGVSSDASATMKKFKGNGHALIRR